MRSFLNRYVLILGLLTLAPIAATLLLSHPAEAVSSDAVTFRGDRVWLGSAYFHRKTVAVPEVTAIGDNVMDGGTHVATHTLVPATSSVLLACADTDGCDITLSETGAESGTIVRITNTSANACNFADTSGVTETASSLAMGQFDSLTLLYAADRWVELGRSNN